MRFAVFFQKSINLEYLLIIEAIYSTAQTILQSVEKKRYNGRDSLGVRTSHKTVFDDNLYYIFVVTTIFCRQKYSLNALYYQKCQCTAVAAYFWTIPQSD